MNPYLNFERRRHGPQSFHGLIQALSSGDDMQALQSLSNLSTELAMASEEMLSSLPLEQLISSLLECLQKDYMPDIVLYSMNCITNILDIIPSIGSMVVGMNGLSIITSKLLNFEFIDLAEQSIRALEKVSIQHGVSILKQGGFSAVLGMLQFFQLPCQKQILGIAVNISKSLDSKDTYRGYLQPLVPAMIGLLEYQNADFAIVTQKVLDFFILLVENLARIFGDDPKGLRVQMEVLSQAGIVRIVLGLTQTKLVQKSLKLIRNLCKFSAEVCENFLSDGGSNILKDIIARNFVDVISVIHSLLPSSKSTSLYQSQKKQFYQNHPAYLLQICQIAFPRILSQYDKLGSRTQKLLVIQTLEKLITNLPSNQLPRQVCTRNFSGFLADLLGSDEYSTVKISLSIVYELYDKIPQEIASSFYREGVLAKVQDLKHPDNIRNLKLHQKDPALSSVNIRRLLSQSGQTDTQMIEQIIHNFKMSRSFLPQEEIVRIQRSNSESRDQGKSQILILTKKILTKHRKHENKGAQQLGKELKVLSDRLDMANGQSAVEIWTRLLPTVSNMSHFQLSNSNLPISLWKWLTNGQMPILLKRVDEFMKVFSQKTGDQTYLARLLNLLVGSALFVRSFTLQEKQSNRNQPVKAHFVYVPQDNPSLYQQFRQQYEIRHQLFHQTKRFNITLDPNISVSQIQSKLIRVKSKQDLNLLRTLLRGSGLRGVSRKQQKFQELLQMGFSQQDAMIELQMEDQDESSVRDEISVSDLTVELLQNGRQLKKELMVKDLRQGQMTFQFRLSKKVVLPEIVSILSDPQQILRDLIIRSQEIGLKNTDKAYSYFRLAAFIQSLSKSSIFMKQRSKSLNITSAKLSSLLLRQLQGALPPIDSWTRNLPVHCKFLFHFKVRYEHFQKLNKQRVLQQRQQKLKVSRDCIIQNAIQIFSNLRLIKSAPLEIQFQDQVGTGLGPTLEFYSLVAAEVRKLLIWRPEQEYGLFPAPLQVSGTRALEYFYMLGTLVAKALVDHKQVDLPFSPVWWKLIMSQKLTLTDMKTLDPNLGKPLIKLASQLSKGTNLQYKGASVQDLCFSFVLPGYPQIQLKPNGSSILVTESSLSEYIQLVTQHTLYQPSQARAFRKGLQSLISLQHFSVFQPEQLQLILCGDKSQAWDIETLTEQIVPDHGYTRSSNTFQSVLHIMAAFSLEERKQFLLFVTGAPRLPLGGFGGLKPKLNVVRKDPSLPGHHPDEYLPSVMTCQNYLKIPDYSSMEILETRLKYAINEGFQAFHLS